MNRDHHGGLHKAVLNGSESEVESLISAGKGKLKIHVSVFQLAIIISNCTVCKPVCPSPLPSGRSVSRSERRSACRSVVRSFGRSR